MKNWDNLMKAMVAVMREEIADDDNEMSTPEEREYVVDLTADAGDRVFDLIHSLARDYSECYWADRAADLGRPTDHYHGKSASRCAEFGKGVKRARS